MPRAGELSFIEWLKQYIRRHRALVEIDAGDDAAAFRGRKGLTLFTTDVLIDGVHFRSETVSPYQIGRKAMAKNLSDIAAMGCTPTYAVCTIALPRSASMGYAKNLYRGLSEMAHRFGVKLVGGDLATHQGKLSVSVALLGVQPLCKGECRGLKPIRRSGAKVGDAIFVTGKLGGSILGKHLSFTPRIKEALALNKKYTLHAMIDITDGLVRDLSHICTASRAGAVLAEERIPISAAARRLATPHSRLTTHDSPLTHALYDGEDYELLFTVPTSQARDIERKCRFYRIGEIVRGKGIFLQERSGRIRPLKISGYEHQFGSAK